MLHPPRQRGFFLYALFVSGVYFGLGHGGMEKMIVYPVLLWYVGFGGHLMATKEAAILN
jgi:hypothetical protein